MQRIVCGLALTLVVVAAATEALMLAPALAW